MNILRPIGTIGKPSYLTKHTKKGKISWKFAQFGRGIDVLLHIKIFPGTFWELICSL